jgi:HD-GYP domain-containing protein (c-di-GMP phosphodiesterase class II)
MSKEKALEIIKNESGKHLDPDLVNVFIRIIKEQI